MAPNEGEYKTAGLLPKELRHLKTSRDIEWLKHYLRRNGVDWPEIDLFAENLEIAIAQAITQAKTPACSAPVILAAHREAFVSNEHLTWIDTQNDRLQIWLLRRIWDDLINAPAMWPDTYLAPQNRPQIRALSSIPSHERRREILRAMDFWLAPATVKQQWLNDQKLGWGKHIAHDKRYVKWLSKTDGKSRKEPFDQDLLEWALGYLNSHDKILNVPQATTIEETYAIVASTIDGISSAPHAPEKTLFIETMKKAWSQKKYRASGKTKKPYHLPLTVKAKSNLDWLEVQTGYRASDILGALINHECERVKGGKLSRLAKERSSESHQKIVENTEKSKPNQS